MYTCVHIYNTYYIYIIYMYTYLHTCKYSMYTYYIYIYLIIYIYYVIYIHKYQQEDLQPPNALHKLRMLGAIFGPTCVSTSPGWTQCTGILVQQRNHGGVSIGKSSIIDVYLSASHVWWYLRLFEAIWGYLMCSSTKFDLLYWNCMFDWGYLRLFDVFNQIWSFI